VVQDTLRCMKQLMLGLLLCLPIMALAQPQRHTPRDSGNDFLHDCGEQVPALSDSDKVECLMYIAGLYDGLTSFQDASGIMLFDPPYGITMGQVKKIAEKYMNDHPSSLHEWTAKLVLKALMEAYPTKKR